jgi:hypothetical protein
MSDETLNSLLRLGVTVGLGSTPLGTAGYILGGVLGGVLFPPDAPEAPDPYTDLGTNATGSNTRVAISYGVNKIAGTHIYKGDLRYQAVEEGGGKATGNPTVTGFQYWGNYIIGVCRTDGTPITFTRIWENDNILMHESDETITTYKGTDTQTVDSDWDAAVDNAVPMRRLAYVSYWDHYLGENNNHTPPTFHEVHRIPYSTAVVDGGAGTSPIVSTMRQEIAYGGIVAVDKFEEVIVAHKDEVKVYDRAYNLRNTVDISSLSIDSSTATGYTMAITYRSYGTAIHIIWTDQVANKLKMATFSKNSTVGLNSLNSATIELTAFATQPDGLSACVNEDFIFVSYQNAANDAHILKLNWAGTTLADYDLSGDLGTDEIIGCAASDEFLFIAQGGTSNLRSYSFVGVLIDTETVNNSRAMAWIPGSRVIATLDADTDLNLYSYDSTGTFSSVTPPEQRISGLSGFGANPFDFGGDWFNLHFGINGTMLISEYSAVPAVNNTWITSYDANPAQIIYDAFVNIKSIDSALIALDTLKDFGDACVDNNIGMSFKLLGKRSLGALLRDMLGHCDGKVRINAEGKLEILLPLTTDSSVGTIQIDDIAMRMNDGTDDLSIIKTSQKDIEMAPNRLNVTYTNRFNDYKEDATFPIDDMLAQDLDGEITDSDLPMPFYTNPKTAKKCAWRNYKLNRYANDLHVCVLRPEWLFLLPGDVVTVNLTDYGYTSKRMRVFSVNYPPLDGVNPANVVVTLAPADTWIEQFDDIDYDGSLSEDTSSSPPSDVFPIVWEENAEQNDGLLMIGVTGIRDNDDTAFAELYISVDDESNYTFIDKITKFANVADIASAVSEFDTNITINTSNYPGSTFSAYGVDDQRNELSLCIAGERSAGVASLSSFEMLSYRGTKTSGSDLILENVARGKGYTLPDVDHSTDAVILHIGRTYFRRLARTDWIGKTIYVKLVPGNDKGIKATLADVTGHSFVVNGYGLKSTHVAGLCGQESGVTMGSREIFGTNTITLQWKQVSNKDGWGIRGSSSQYVYETFDASDTTGYDLLIYTTVAGEPGALQATHLEIAFTDTNNLLTYDYTSAQNTTDFGVLTKDFFYGIRPRNTKGVNSDFVVLRRAILNT